MKKKQSLQNDMKYKNKSLHIDSLYTSHLKSSPHRLKHYSQIYHMIYFLWIDAYISWVSRINFDFFF